MLTSSRAKPFAALAAKLRTPPEHLLQWRDIKLDDVPLTQEIIADLVELVAVSPDLATLSLVNAKLDAQSMQRLSVAINKSTRGLRLVNLSGANELGTAESLLRVATVRAALKQPTVQTELVLPIETEDELFTRFICVAPKDGASTEAVRVSANLIAAMLEGVADLDASRLFAELVAGRFLLSTSTRSYLCLDIGIACRARYTQLRFDDPDAAAASARISRAAIAAVCAVLADLPRAAVDSVWDDYSLVFEHAIENVVPQLTTLPIVQLAHWRLLFGSLGVAVRKEHRSLASRLAGGLAYLLLSLALQPAFFLLFMLLPDSHGLISRRLVLFGRPLVWVTDPWLRLLSDRAATIVLVVLMLSMPAVDGIADRSFKSVWALLITFGLLATELEELLYLGILRSPFSALARMLADEWNVLDLIALICCLVGLPTYISENVQQLVEEGPVLPGTLDSAASRAGIDGSFVSAHVERLARFSPSGQHVTDSFLAGAVFLLTVRQLRMLYLSRILGSYVQMLYNMVGDVFKIGALALPIVLAFAFAMVQLHKSPKYDTPIDDDPRCEEQRTDFQQLGPALLNLVETMTGGAEPEMGCLGSTGAWIIYLLFMITAVVLLLNMLIAAMTRTFDQVSEQSEAYAIFNLCKLAQSSARLPLVAPPFNLLGMPSRLIVELSRAGARGTFLGCSALLDCTGYSALLDPDTRTTKKAAADDGLATLTLADKRKARHIGRRWSHLGGWHQGELHGSAFDGRHADMQSLLIERAVQRIVAYIGTQLVSTSDVVNWREAISRDLAHVRQAHERVEQMLSDMHQLTVRTPWTWPAKAAGGRTKTPPRGNDGERGGHGLS